MYKTRSLVGLLIITAIILSICVYFYNFDHLHLLKKNGLNDSLMTGKEESKVKITNSSSMKNTEIKIDEASGFIIDTGFEEVRANCLGCHSSLLITQNRATRDGWLSTIRWMQETQNFLELGDNETIILDYLAKNYSPQKGIGRRANLKNVQWSSFEKKPLNYRLRKE